MEICLTLLNRSPDCWL